KVYPNPITSGALYIQSNVTGKDDYQLQLLNLSGQIIKATRFRPLAQMQYMISIEDEIPDGEYIISIKGSAFVQSEKIVLAR
ncbi:MAG: T9SS type A sorting domain-containing protein, partial [Saprospiraceae bacterium]